MMTSAELDWLLAVEVSSIALCNLGPLTLTRPLVIHARRTFG